LITDSWTYNKSTMPTEQTLVLISALAAGCDPATGEEFDPTHVLRRKDVTKALNEALKAMGGKAAKRPRRPIVKSDYFAMAEFNRLSAKTRKDLAERVLRLPMTFPLDQPNSRVVRTEHARSQEPWKKLEQDMLAMVLPHTNDLKFLSIVFQRSEKAMQTEARRLMAERSELREALGNAPTVPQPAPQNDAPAKAYSVAKEREANPQAYARWSAEDDAMLENLYRKGMTKKSLAAHFGRRRSAIDSRIRKLEL